ncbi:MAG: Stp1/IreP family PP2C-type Ser/Thr phosphatase [Candidatus Aminicenantes bacterium]|nr:Stp1/IreP family PP2C-type Ser/Thr phosphatase [Candidatus Aminicenantes bacterium]
MRDFEYFGHTDIGTKRESNEDNYLCLDLPLRPEVSGSPAVVLMVADGIGGQAGGAVASGLATEALKSFLVRRLKELTHPPDWRALLDESFHEANQKIFDKIAENINLTGMGTTLVAAVVLGGRAFVANVGDSRAYAIREDEIRQITEDHSWVAEQSRIRAMSEVEINRSPFRHMITRSLGFGPEIRMDFFEVDLEDGDFLLLCSDGLYSAVPDAEILKIFKKYDDPEKICRKLLKSANHSGGRDNITAVVARNGRPPRKAKHPFSATIRLDTNLPVKDADSNPDRKGK